jgi:PhoPQ-activated pathogenicity-related protein
MNPETPYTELTIEQRAKVAARFRDDLFEVDSAQFFYQFTPGGLFRRPITLSPARTTRASRKPQIVIHESGTPVITPLLMDILIRAYFNHVQGETNQ